MKTFQPWTQYAPLTKERLSIIANIIRRVRDETVELYDPENGDNPWDLGCRVYSRICYEIRKASLCYGWLSIVEEKEALRFTFAIGHVPIRFYHGGACDTPSHYLITTPAEAQQQSLALEFVGIKFQGVILRIAVESGANRLTSTVTLVTVDPHGIALEGYGIPSEVVAVTPETRTSVVTMQKEAIALSPVGVEPLQQEGSSEQTKEAKDAGDRS